MLSKKKGNVGMIGFLGYFVLAVLSSVLLIGIFIQVASSFDIRNNTNKEIAVDVVDSIKSFVDYNIERDNSPVACYSSLKISNQEVFQRTGFEDKKVTTSFFYREKTAEERLDERVFFFVVDNFGAYAYPLSEYSTIISDQEFNSDDAEYSVSFNTQLSSVGRDETGVEYGTKSVCSEYETVCTRDCYERCSEYKEVPTYTVKETSNFDFITQGMEIDTEVDFLLIYPVMGIENTEEVFSKGDAIKQLQSTYIVETCKKGESCGLAAQAIPVDRAGQYSREAIGLGIGVVATGAVVGVAGIFLTPFTGGLSLIGTTAVIGGLLIGSGVVANLFSTGESNDQTYIVFDRDQRILFSPVSSFSENYALGNDCSVREFKEERLEQKLKEDFFLIDYIYRDEIYLGHFTPEDDFSNNEEKGYYFKYEKQELTNDGSFVSPFLCYERFPGETIEDIEQVKDTRDSIDCTFLVEKILEGKDLNEKTFCIPYLTYGDQPLCYNYEGSEFDRRLQDILFVQNFRSESESLSDTEINNLNYILNVRQDTEFLFADLDYPFFVKLLSEYYNSLEQEGELKTFSESDPFLTTSDIFLAPDVPFTSFFEPYPFNPSIGDECENSDFRECSLGKHFFDYRHFEETCLGIFGCPFGRKNGIEIKEDTKFEQYIYDIDEEVEISKDLSGKFINAFLETVPLGKTSAWSGEKLLPDLNFYELDNPNMLSKKIIIQQPTQSSVRTAYFYYDYPTTFIREVVGNEEVNDPRDYVGGGFYSFRHETVRLIQGSEGLDFFFNGKIIEAKKLSVKNSKSSFKKKDELFLLQIPFVRLPLDSSLGGTGGTVINVVFTQEQVDEMGRLVLLDDGETLEEVPE